MADIVITTDFSQVNALNNTLKSTDSLFTKVVDSLLREETRARRVTKALAKTTEENLALIEKAEAIVAKKVQVAAQKREKARQREAERAEKEAKRIADAAEKAAKAEAKAAEQAERLAKQIAANQAASAQKSTADFNQRVGITGTPATQSGASFSAMQAEIVRLELMYNKVAVATRVYEQAQESLNRAVMMGIITEDEHKAKLNEMALAYQKVGNSADNAQTFINRFGESAQVSGRGLNNFGMYAQQVGYQVGDFFVQVQSGTNVLVAFGQQATQLAGLIPGVWGAAIGIGISLATALGAAWMRTTEDVSNGSKQQGEAIGRLIDKIRELRLERQMASTGTLTADEQLSLNEINDLMKERAELQKQVTDLTSEEMLTASQGYSAMAAIFLNWTDEKKQARIDEINEILRQLDYERQLETSATRRANEVRNRYREEKKATEEHAAQVKLMGDQLAAQGRMKTAAEAVLEKFGMMRTVAAGVADELERGVAAAFAIANQGSPAQLAYGGRGTVSDKSVIDQYGNPVPVYFQNRPRHRPVDIDFGVPPEPKKTGSKGPSEDTINNKLEEVYKYLEVSKYQIEQENIAYSQRQDALETALQKKLLTQQEYNQLELDLAAKHAKEVADIENKAKVQKLSTVLGSGAQILEAIGQHNEKAAKMARVFGAAQALADTYAGAAAALKLPFPANLAAASSIIAAGLGFVSAIKSGSTSARPSSGSVARDSATVANSAPAQAPQTVYIDSIKPESLYSGETLIKLFDSFYDENDKRGKVFMVAR